MTAVERTDGSSVVEYTGERRRSLLVAALCAVLGVATLVLFARTAQSGQTSTMLLNPRGDDTLPDVDLPTRVTMFVLAFGSVALGAAALRAHHARLNRYLGGALGLFALALVVWAAR